MGDRSQLRNVCRVPSGGIAADHCDASTHSTSTRADYGDLAPEVVLRAIEHAFAAQERGGNYQEAFHAYVDPLVDELNRRRDRCADQETEMYDDDDEDGTCACRVDADQPRDERGRFAASQSSAATEASAKANEKGSRAANQRAADLHQSAAAAHARAANDHPAGSPEHAEHKAKVAEHLAAARDHQIAVRESKGAAKAASAEKPTTATPTNISALAEHVAQHGGHPEFTNKVEATSVSHIQRTVKAGLVEHASPSTLRLTAAGHAAVLGHLKKEATRLTHPAYNRPEDDAKRERIASAITNLAANPAKLDAADFLDANEYGRLAMRAAARSMLEQPGANGRVIERPTPRADHKTYGTDERAAAEMMRRASENAWKGK
ncbi:MAG: hypothetical protein JO257_05995 [Deltaproteobacteria bacterium]|nr:hypothetical protein [Deltaproteobacteria bacterium]